MTNDFLSVDVYLDLTAAPESPTFVVGAFQDAIFDLDEDSASSHGASQGGGLRLSC
ncbi:MAG: hypothetical protein GDA41_04815 [Rhodospirillales bacterium]|nr:hypothetical protein [Rhodospirillales bacterium]